jgi:WXG100 family type VII secretion target
MSFQVTPEYVANAATSCDTTASEVQDQLATLRAYVVNMEDWWQGFASNTFQSLMTEYDVCSAVLNNALTGIGNGLRGNWSNYTENEQQNAANINTIQTGLPSPNLG